MTDHKAAIAGVAMLADNKSVVSAGADKAVRVWNPAAVRIFAGHQGPIFSVAVHPGGAQLFTASADKSIKVFDVNNGQRRSNARRPHGRGQGGRRLEGWNQGDLGLGRQDVPRLERGGRQSR